MKNCRSKIEIKLSEKDLDILVCALDYYHEVLLKSRAFTAASHVYNFSKLLYVYRLSLV